MLLRNSTLPSSLRALTMPCLGMMVCASPAIAQDAQSAPDVPAVRLTNVSVRPDWVRYENTASSRPSVIVYATIRNPTSSPILLMPNMFETSLLQANHVYGSSGYTVAVGTAAEQEGSFTAGRTLAPNHFVTLVFRYQLQERVSAVPSTWTVKERPLTALLGKTSSAARFSIPIYMPPLQTPPIPPLRNVGLQALRTPSSFIQLGPVRLRLDQISYGVSSVLDKWGPVLASIDATVQNVTNAVIEIDPGYFDSYLLDDADKKTKYDFSNFIQNNNSVYNKVRLNPGEAMPARINFNMQSDNGLRSVRRLDIRYTNSDLTTGFLSIDLPRFTKVATSQDAAKAPTPTPTPTPTAAHPPTSAPAPTPASTTTTSSAAVTGAFQKTAYMDVKVDGVTRRKAGGFEVTLTVRNKIGRRLGLQHDWQNYSVLGSDGMEYRSDGNHYGTSGGDSLKTTVWLENDDEAKRTYVFDRVPYSTVPVRLIIREYGKEKASIDLPK